jgi:hypothetical protein
MLKLPFLALALVLGACASPNLPEAYRSQSQPRAIDCAAYPEPPAPASCRNLYEGIVHPAQLPPIDGTQLQ